MSLFQTILIVDDEPRTREGLRKTVDMWAVGKYEVISAANADEAIEIAKRKPIHLLITDIRMPEMTGLELIKQLRLLGSRPVTIIISAYSEFAYAQEAITLGVVNYLLKPIDRDELLRAAEEAIEVWKERQKTETAKKIIDQHVFEAEEGIRSPLIRQAIQFVGEHLHQPFSLREVSEFLHVNASYLSALFKEETNLTFSEYVTRSRLQKAKSLLLTTNLTVAEVAEQVGYQTVKYFVKLFKEFEGITPSQFRKEHLKKVDF
ncbi:DNA-binding response regulator [Geobacillus sp. 46C-IIa]|uniref:response regulator transcription factor n=1 Tax=Geobacillus sp. 46C-IIa TaxID=1963025 RepID=UPI0009BDFEED|nr:response regulator [Geobacillus sp. 46C-IIa]OQP06143.1 DNA-binding response regulator [Geobacillus sp. 46C-IIa]QNU29341.1 response regulator [Geobacillus sp. 46C-IIa]